MVFGCYNSIQNVRLKWRIFQQKMKRVSLYNTPELCFVQLYATVCIGLGSDTVLIAVVISVAVTTVVFLILISLIIYKCLNGTRNICKLEIAIQVLYMCIMQVVHCIQLHSSTVGTGQCGWCFSTKKIVYYQNRTNLHIFLCPVLILPKMLCMPLYQTWHKALLHLPI